MSNHGVKSCGKGFVSCVQDDKKRCLDSPVSVSSPKVLINAKRVLNMAV